MKGCAYCTESREMKIEEAWGKDKAVNEEIKLFIDGEPGEWFLGIDYENDEAYGFYVDISYCPMCGRELNPKEERNG